MPRSHEAREGLSWGVHSMGVFSDGGRTGAGNGLLHVAGGGRRLWHAYLSPKSVGLRPPPPTPKWCIRTAVHRRRRGFTPPPSTPLPPHHLPFQCLRLTGNILLRCQED